jgi:hypothetical protein
VAMRDDSLTWMIRTLSTMLLLTDEPCFLELGTPTEKVQVRRLLMLWVSSLW